MKCSVPLTKQQWNLICYALGFTAQGLKNKEASTADNGKLIQELLRIFGQIKEETENV